MKYTANSIHHKPGGTGTAVQRDPNAWQNYFLYKETDFMRPKYLKLLRQTKTVTIFKTRNFSNRRPLGLLALGAKKNLTASLVGGKTCLIRGGIYFHTHSKPLPMATT